MKQLYLHAVVVKKPIEKEDAIRIAKDIIKRKPTFIRETEESYRLRNLPKTRFDSKSFRSRVVNNNVTIIFGHLKD